MANRQELADYWMQAFELWEKEGDGTCFLHPEDRRAVQEFLLRPPPNLTREGYAAAINQNQTSIDPRLLPVPYIGSLKEGSIFLVMANPGLGPDDPFQEYVGDPLGPTTEQRNAFVEALKANLRQDDKMGYPFFYLDPRFEDFSGARYWLNTRGQTQGCQNLRALIEAIAKRTQISPEVARESLAKHLVVLQSMPYHSKALPAFQSEGHISKLRTSLPTLITEAISGKILLILARKSALWNDLLVDARIQRPGSGEARWVTEHIWCIRQADPGRGPIGFGGGGDLIDAIVEWMRRKAS